MNLLRKIGRIFTTNPSRSNSEEYTDYNEEDNIEMLSTSITRSIYSPDDTCVLPILSESTDLNSTMGSSKSSTRLTRDTATSRVVFNEGTKSDDDEDDNDETDNVDTLSTDTSPSTDQPSQLSQPAISRQGPPRSILRSWWGKPDDDRRETGPIIPKRQTVHFDAISKSDTLTSEELRKALSSADLKQLKKEDSDTKSGYSDASGYGLVETIKVPSSVESLELLKQQMEEMGSPQASMHSEIELREDREVKPRAARDVEAKETAESEVKTIEEGTTTPTPPLPARLAAEVGLGIRRQMGSVKSDDSLELIRKQVQAMRRRGAPGIRLSSNIKIKEEDARLNLSISALEKKRRSTGSQLEGVQRMSSFDVRPSVSDDEIPAFALGKTGGLKAKKQREKAKAKAKSKKSIVKPVALVEQELSEEAIIHIKEIEQRKAEDRRNKLQMEMQKSSEEFIRGLHGDEESDSDIQIVTTVTDISGKDDRVSIRTATSKIMDFDEFFDEMFAEHYAPEKKGSRASMRASAMSLGAHKSGAEELQKFIEQHLGEMSTGHAPDEGGFVARNSLLPEIRADHIAFKGIKRKVYSMPVNMKAAEFQYRDLHRGDLVRMYRYSMDVFDYNAIMPVDEKMSGVKLRRKLWLAVLTMFKYGLQQDAIVLEMYEFYTLLFFHEVNVEQLTKDFDLISELGPLIGMMLKMFNVIFIDAPVMMFVMTMASMTRFSYLKFYNSMPLLRGLGYGMFGLFLISEARACSLLDLGTKFLIRIAVIRSKWQSCDIKYEGTTIQFREKCIPFPTNITHNNYCPKRFHRWNNTESFAMQHYLRYVNAASSYSGSKEEEYALYAFVSFVWFIIFALAWSGFNRTKKVSAQLLAIVLMPVILVCVVIILFRGTYENIGYHKYSLEKFLDPTLPFLTWVSSMKPDKADPEVITLCIVFFKLIWYLLIFSAAQVCVFDVIQRYKINPECFTIETISYVFGLIPEFFSKTNLGTLFTPAWWIILNMLVFLRAVYVLQMAIETICQIVPSMRRFPFFVSASLCLGCITIVKLHYNADANLFLKNLFNYDSNSCIIVMFSIFLIGLRFFYSWTRWRDDYMFIYSRYPANIWRIWLNSSVFFSLVLISYVFVAEVVIFKLNHITSIFLVICMLSIGLMMLLKHICHYVFIHQAYASIRPTSDWRPHDPSVRNYRRFYFSKRDIRKRKSRKMFACTRHQCLNQAKLYTMAVTRQQDLLDPRREKQREAKIGKLSEARKSEFAGQVTTWQSYQVHMHQQEHTT